MSTTGIDPHIANGCCNGCLCVELSCRNLGLSHPNPTLFVTSQGPEARDGGWGAIDEFSPKLQHLATLLWASAHDTRTQGQESTAPCTRPSAVDTLHLNDNDYLIHTAKHADYTSQTKISLHHVERETAMFGPHIHNHEKPSSNPVLFAPSNLGLIKSFYIVLVQSAVWWRCPTVVYAVYRGVVALYFVSWIVLSGVWTYDWAASNSDRVKWFIYLTNWSFLVLTFDVLLQAVLVVLACGKTGKYDVTVNRERQHVITTRRLTIYYLCAADATNDAMPWYYKLSWLIHNVASNASFVISIGFWTLVNEDGTDVHPVDWNTHGVNAAYVLVDTFITAIPVRLLHFYHGVMFLSLFAIFSVLYETVAGQTNALGEPYIYSVLDWSQPQTAAIYSVLVCLVATPVLWLLVFALYKLRLALHRAVGHK
ncbi:hypothetical protein NP493_467g02033 [Ridgeia piscesae]|uniref:Protein rolling stone n=1 Tax=Ridgeia piscesae TaxID=27915 RepID=A0AAD9KYF3_RIDPI|nr:hypothetical protein NP493_467g02033 [Ridgeia piscesae]